MKRIFRKYPEAILAVLSLIFVAAILYAFTWGIGDIVSALQTAANGASEGPQAPGFNLQAARALDLRGLVKPSQ